MNNSQHSMNISNVFGWGMGMTGFDRCGVYAGG